jgi:carbonic anhydrase
MHTYTAETRDRLTPADALRILKDGNSRFRANLKANRNLRQQMDETSDGQWPFAVVLSCIDSRTSTELVFDQGIGDIFSIRIAGNFLNDDILGSMEFACSVAGAKLIVVLGHSHCGAIKGACDQVELGHLSGMLRKIQPSVGAVSTPAGTSDRSSANQRFVAAVSRDNVLRGTLGIMERSNVLRTMHEDGAIDVVGGMYDVVTGSVEFFSTANEGDAKARVADISSVAADPSRGEKLGDGSITHRASTAAVDDSAGTRANSDPRLINDVPETTEAAPSGKAATRSAGARSLPLVIAGLALIGPVVELIRFGRIDLQSPAVIGTGLLLLLSALCWGLGSRDTATKQHDRHPYAERHTALELVASGLSALRQSESSSPRAVRGPARLRVVSSSPPGVRPWGG